MTPVYGIPRPIEPQRSPQTLDEYGCWLNCWGDSMLKERSKVERRAYEDGIYDAFLHFNRLTNHGWMVAWQEWTKRRGS